MDIIAAKVLKLYDCLNLTNDTMIIKFSGANLAEIQKNNTNRKILTLLRYHPTLAALT